MSRRSCLLIFFLSLACLGLAQSAFRLEGYVRSSTGEAIRQAHLVVDVGGQRKGLSTDNQGFYRLLLPSSHFLRLHLSHTAYEEQFDSLWLRDSLHRRDYVMKTKVTSLPEATVVARQPTMQTQLDPKILNKLPSVGGGVEALIKTLPGVSSNNELSSQFSVRGGNFDENLVYVNDIEIFRPLLVRSGEQEGLSFVHPDLVGSLQFSAGGFAAKYGDKMSSVLDIRYKRPTRFAGSASVHLLGASAHVEGVSTDQRFRFLLGARYKNNAYLLSSMQTQGQYKPSFTDVQTYLSYDLHPQWELSFLGNISLNNYFLVPESSTTRFGTVEQAMSLRVFFDGQEVDRFNSLFGALTAVYKPDALTQHRFTLGGFGSRERETFDIEGAYLLSETEADFSSDAFGDPIRNLGVGAFHNHARNNLESEVFHANYQGQRLAHRFFWMWGLKYQMEHISDDLNEWRRVDSSGFTLPGFPVLPGFVSAPQPPVLQNRYFARQDLLTHRGNAFVQSHIDLGRDLSLTAGLRFSYWDFNREFLLSPRLHLQYTPEALRDWSFRFSTGLYYQPPFYRELRAISGELNPDIRSQRAIHFVAGVDYWFSLWGRPFKAVGEVYYKHLSHLIPYEVDNVRIRYLAENAAQGYAAGLDLRVNGELVPGVESWLSFSWMKTEEKIDGLGGYIPRPTDQRYNFNLFFQDYISANDRLKVQLNLVFGGGLPYGSPQSLVDRSLFLSRDQLRLPPYQRVDIGFSYLFKFWKAADIWLSAEIFNIFDMKNIISYQWFSDFSGHQYAVANYLTPRRFNVKLSVQF